MKTISENRCFGGIQGVYSHSSAACACDMTFAVFLPEEAQHGPVPVLWFLSGLTCTHENAMVKAGAQAWAAEQGIALVFPDTSPRGDAVPNDSAFDLGQGAGFYVDATQAPWDANFKMWTYVTAELPALLANNFAVDMDRQSIMGHSMGGHGALTMAMRLPDRFKSVSAFAPICNPTKSDWGRKQFSAYLGNDESKWSVHDATEQMADGGFDGPILIDTGTDDQFGELLGTEEFASAFVGCGQEGQIRLQKGYDHSYFFIATFVEDHVVYHAQALYS